ncbi:hypothetical protein FQN51_005141 [Onygenales sp. PD_10]|nr:hypothetical protein FQN51_005141 [Onygenales sp. PD_10]
MPHKHKRRQKENPDNYDLPPTKVAKPLPTKESDSIFTSKKPKQKKPQAAFKDDTPKAFARMMQQLQKASSTGGAIPRTPSGLDDGTRPNKQNRKRKRGEQDASNAQERSNNDPSSKKPNTKPTTTPTTTTTTTTNIPKILPGERMSDFAARVDQALPLSGISRKSGSTTQGKDPALRNLREQRQTKHERRLLRLQREWREEEVRICEREEAEREEREAEDEEINEQWKAWEIEAGVTKKKKATTTGAKSKKKKKKGKKGKAGAGGGGEDVDSQSDDGDDDDDDDPWAKLNQKARAVRAINPLEQVQAPPMQLVKPKEKFKVRGMGGAKVNVVDIPAAAGSLRRREELAGQRQSIVDEYRRIMAEKRG